MGKIAFLFPGQGGPVRRHGEAAGRVAPQRPRAVRPRRAVLGYDLAKLCFEGPAEDLDSTVCSQPALFVTSLAALRPSGRVAGRGAGLRGGGGLEPGRIHRDRLCRAMDFEAGLTLVQHRGAAMQAASDASPSGMVSILGLERVQVEALCDKARDGEVLEIANLLCPGNIAISGTNAACERAADLARLARAP